MHPRGKAFVLAGFAIAALLLWESRGDGPDFGHYFEWGRAAVSADIFDLEGDVLSSGGVPFSQWSAAPGMLFAATYRAAGDLIELRTAAYLTGWAAAMLFWLSAFAALRVVTRDNLALVLLGSGVLFAGTHAGFYSHAYSTELLASALIAALWALALSRTRPEFLASAAAGAFAGLLLFLRPYLVLYAAAPLWLIVVRPYGAWRDTMRRRTIVKLAAAAIPLVLAAFECAAVNRWMTGSPLHSPYVYGGFGFHSVDLLNPQPGVVLIHPWRGLLAYHPLYAVAFVALLIRAVRSGALRILWASTLAIVLVHLWIQSAWHIWWLGGSFGMRGLAPAAFPLVAALVATISQDLDERPHRAVWWVRASLIACAWSLSLLLQPSTRYLAWPDLLAGQAPAGIAAGALVLVWMVVEVCRRRWQMPAIRTEVFHSGVVLLAISFGYLVARIEGRPGAILVLTAAVVAIAAFYLERVPGWKWSSALRVACAAAVVLFAAQALIFARLATRTERFLASGEPPPRPFRSVGSVPVDDLRQNYAEYLDIPGFDDRKRMLRAYLNWLEIAAAEMTPAERDLSERVLRAISSDPIAGTMFVRVTARNRVVHLASSDSNADQRERVVEIVRQVPGVAGVETDMK